MNRNEEMNKYKKKWEFTDAQAAAALAFAEKYDQPLDPVFAYVDDLCFFEYYAGPEKNLLLPPEKELKRRVLQAHQLYFMGLKYDLNIRALMRIMSAFEKIGVDMEELEPYVVHLYLDSELYVGTFWYYYQYALEHKDQIRNLRSFIRDCQVYRVSEALAYNASEPEEPFDTDFDEERDWYENIECNPHNNLQEPEEYYFEKFDVDFSEGGDSFDEKYNSENPYED